MGKTKTKVANEVEVNEIKGLLRKKIEEKHGSVAAFLKTDIALKLGGQKIRTYLYDTGTVNYKVLSRLCEFYGLGVLTREITVVRSVVYQLTKSTIATK